MLLGDELRPGCSSDLDQDAFSELLKYSWCKSTRELGLDLSTDQSTICCHLNKRGKVSKLGVWVPHNLIEQNKKDFIFIGNNLPKKENELFLLNIMTGNKKWVFYDNVQCKRQWIDDDKSPLATPKAELFGRKIMLCVW